MKFDRTPRYGDFEWTARKLAAAQTRGQRRLQSEAKRVPLLADQLAQPKSFDADAERAARNADSHRAEKNIRDLDAKHWRHGRAMYQRATPEQQAAIRAAWLAWTGPRRPGYYIYVVELHTGVQEQRSLKFKAEERAMKQRIWHQITAQQVLDLEAA